MKGRPVVRRAMALLVAVLLVSGSQAPSLAPPRDRGRTYVTNNCLRVRTEPRSILFACGDGGYYVDHLTWSRWHTWRAAGFGLFHANDCRPSCAEATFHTAWGHLRLRLRVPCDRPDVSVFDRARVRYRGTLLGRPSVSFGHLGCPLRS
jgi:hypothetical protein